MCAAGFFSVRSIPCHRAPVKSKNGLGDVRPWCVSQTLFLRAVRFLRFLRFGAFFSVTSSKQWDCLTCNIGSPTKRLVQVTEMDSGRRIHVPVLKCRITIFHFFEELGHFYSYHGKVAKPKTTRRSRQHTAFPGIFPLLRRVLKPTTTCGLSSVCLCVCKCNVM